MSKPVNHATVTRLVQSAKLTSEEKQMYLARISYAPESDLPAIMDEILRASGGAVGAKQSKIGKIEHTR